MNFVVISVALDSGGTAKTEQWIRAAKATYPCLIDERHVTAELYGVVNVSSAVWIDESGRIVRPAETAGTSDAFRTQLDRTTKQMSPEGMAERERVREAYLHALRDWAAAGPASPYALPEDEARRRLPFPARPPLLAGQPPPARAGGRSCANASPRRDESGPDEVGDAGAGVLEVARLVARGLAVDHQPAIGIQPVGSQAAQPGAGGVGQALDRREIDAQIDLGRDLVHVLAARSRGAHGVDGQRRRRDAHRLRHDDRFAHAGPFIASPSYRHCSGGRGLTRPGRSGTIGAMAPPLSAFLLASFVAFFVTVNPIKSAAVFAALTERSGPAHRRSLAIKSVAVAAGILVVFTLFGDDLLRFIGISL